MSVLEHFKDQPIHTRDGVEHLYFLSDKTGKLEMYSLAKTEIEQFLEGTEFAHLAGMIPRFNKPRPKRQTLIPPKKSDGNA